MRTMISALLAVAVLAVLSASGASSASTIEFTATVVGHQTLDIGPKGPSLGDSSATRWRLTDRRGRTIGFGHQVCRWTSSEARVCVGSYVLPDGQVVFEGVLGDGAPLAVTGGTGVYLESSGQVTRTGKTVSISL